MMPQWVPFLGGKPFTFFAPIFNLADASISVGVITILLFQKRFFRQRPAEETGTTVETSTTVNDETQVL
jgi:signal peptidase II